jgi:hypothetical protein
VPVVPAMPAQAEPVGSAVVEAVVMTGEVEVARRLSRRRMTSRWSWPVVVAEARSVASRVALGCLAAAV